MLWKDNLLRNFHGDLTQYYENKFGSVPLWYPVDVTTFTKDYEFNLRNERVQVGDRVRLTEEEVQEEVKECKR